MRQRWQCSAAAHEDLEAAVESEVVAAATQEGLEAAVEAEVTAAAAK